jgi:enoyl-CoA hydratase/carnithine racemase
MYTEMLVYPPPFDTLDTSFEGGVFTVKMNRPKRKNAFNNQQYDSFSKTKANLEDTMS